MAKKDDDSDKAIVSLANLKKGRQGINLEDLLTSKSKTPDIFELEQPIPAGSYDFHILDEEKKYEELLK